MTALDKFEKLECPGLWRETLSEQRRNVFVSLGDATLIIKDATDTALAHWSLPAVERSNPGTVPAIYTPGGDAEEELEIDDDTMIEAIRTVQQAVARTKPQRGRLRRMILGLSLLAVAVLAVFWLPGALVRHTAQVLPDTVRQEIGQRLLKNLVPFTGAACTDATGTRVLNQLKRRTLGPESWNVVVVPSGPALSAHLPGAMILLRKDVIEDERTPDLAAGAIVLEAARARHVDPLLAVLDQAGPFATLRLLTQGEIGDAVLQAAAQTYLVTPPVSVPEAQLAEKFRAVQVDPAAIAARSGLTIPPLTTPPEKPLLSDSAWLRLGAICSG
ncbi:hypothetical protein [Meridianimarinicoccus sp. MJW13]|uniref:hypothetical protein n=1 Tax=Meridianimarinicoccus sp. MJW13 TaxID=2720031 RepID=UPI001867A6AA|nr:hypothetical protein [Fluviibacterium sp. MJW13]